MTTARQDLTLSLPDGRQLGYAEYGDPAGRLVMYFTGGNSSRLEGAHWHDIAAELGVRLVIPDRPGFGLSDFQPNRTFLDWPDDVIALADELNIDRFGAFGLSGGGPHLLACAYKIPQRISHAALVSSTAPPEMPGRLKGVWPPVKMVFLTAMHAPGINRFLLKQMGNFYADSDNMLKQMKRGLPAPDVALMERWPEAIIGFSQAAREGHRQGIDGDAWEWQLYNRDWGFSLEDISMEIAIWQGEVDGMVPLGMGQYLAEQLPNSELHVVPDGGHFSTVNNYIRDILSALSAA